LKVFRLPSVFVMLCLCAAVAGAQTRVDAYFAMGTAHDPSSNQQIDFTGTGTALSPPSLGGVFGTLGGGAMLTPSLGVGAEVMFRFAQGDYAGLGYRPIFYDFNGIWTPSLGTRHVMPEVQAGFGGVNMRFYGGGAQSYNPYTGAVSDFAGSSNHLQLHLGVGLRFYVKPHLFVRPQFDYRYVRNFKEFGNSGVPAYTIAVGYSSSR
jgi:hypothetical protein